MAKSSRQHAGPPSLEEYFAFLEEIEIQNRQKEKPVLYKMVFRLDFSDRG